MFSPGAVHLRVHDIERVASFYRETLGLTRRARGELIELGAGVPLVVLHGAPDAPRRPRGAAGLFHQAILLPERASLGSLLTRLAEMRAPIQGASDHGVSEALYMTDPEGNGIEVYADRPAEEWPTQDGRLAMTTEAMDIRGVIAAARGPWRGAPEATRMGHIHLQVHDVPAAERFYLRIPGLEVTTRYGPDASFFAAGGYHHHLATNAWGVSRPAAASTLGLHHFELRLPSADALATARDAFAAGGVAVEDTGAGFMAEDPSGNRIGFFA